jgi:hypothetical protein
LIQNPLTNYLQPLLGSQQAYCFGARLRSHPSNQKWFEGFENRWFCIEIRNDHWKCEFWISRSVKNTNLDAIDGFWTFRINFLVRRTVNVTRGRLFHPVFHKLNSTEQAFHIFKIEAQFNIAWSSSLTSSMPHRLQFLPWLAHDLNISLYGSPSRWLCSVFSYQQKKTWLWTWHLVE